MQMPNFTLPGRGESTQAGGRTFGFARFTNERVSTINIGKSTLERGEKVDDEAISSGGDLGEGEKVTDASSQSGFASVTYDIIGVTEGTSSSSMEPTNNPWETAAQQPSASSTGNHDHSQQMLLVDVGPSPATSGPHESSVKVGGSGSGNKSTVMLAGPPKPSRSVPTVKEEPIYDDVMEVRVQQTI